MSCKYIFLSHVLSEETPTYGNRDKLTVKQNSNINTGATANSFSLIFSTNHIGTHIDLPFHFYENGKKVNDMPTDFWIFNKIELIELRTNDAKIIESKDLSLFDLDENLEILLIRTGYEQYRRSKRYWYENPGISPEVADYLRESFPKIRAVGFDFISLTSFQNRKLGKEAHKAFLGNNDKFIAIIEDMKLAKFTLSCEELIILPLLVDTIDSTPTTILAKINGKQIDV